MTERPILFTGEMVRAILDGRKWQTRRAIRLPGHFTVECRAPGYWPWSVQHEDWIACPYGEPGDRLWVREAWRTVRALDNYSPREIGERAMDAGYHRPWAPLLCADGHGVNAHALGDFGGVWGKTRPSIHMPRWASRITLEVLARRVERLQAISEADAIAEGVDAISMAAVPRQARFTRRGDFAQLWDRINGKRAPWSSNPWVWVIEFRRMSES